MTLIKQDGIIHSAILEPTERVYEVTIRDYDDSEYDTEKGIDSLGVDTLGKVYRKCDCQIFPAGRDLSDVSMKEYIQARIEALLGREDKNVCLEGNVAEIPFQTLFELLTKNTESI